MLEERSAPVIVEVAAAPARSPSGAVPVASEAVAVVAAAAPAAAAPPRARR